MSIMIRDHLDFLDCTFAWAARARDRARSLSAAARREFFFHLPGPIAGNIAGNLPGTPVPVGGHISGGM